MLQFLCYNVEILEIKHFCVVLCNLQVNVHLKSEPLSLHTLMWLRILKSCMHTGFAFVHYYPQCINICKIWVNSNFVISLSGHMCWCVEYVMCYRMRLWRLYSATCRCRGASHCLPFSSKSSSGCHNIKNEVSVHSDLKKILTRLSELDASVQNCIVSLSLQIW